MIDYICKKCNYSTARKSNYERHCISKSHEEANINDGLAKNAKSLAKNAKPNDKKVHKVANCSKCNKTLFNKANLRRHEKSCKGTINEKDMIILKLMEEKNSIQEKLDKANDKVYSLATDLAKANREKVVYNATYINNCYTSAHNIEDLLEIGSLTDNEKKYITNMGAVRGSYKLLNERCIENIAVEDRPFHCVDDSRDKFLLRSEDNWKIDLKGQKIMKHVSDIIQPLYPIEDEPNIVQRNKNAMEIVSLQQGDKKMIKELTNKTLFKNNVTPLIID